MKIKFPLEQRIAAGYLTRADIRQVVAGARAGDLTCQGYIAEIETVPAAQRTKFEQALLRAFRRQP